MESANLTLEELEYIIFAMSKISSDDRSERFNECYAKVLLLIVEQLEREEQNQQKATL